MHPLVGGREGVGGRQHHAGVGVGRAEGYGAGVAAGDVPVGVRAMTVTSKGAPEVTLARSRTARRVAAPLCTSKAPMSLVPATMRGKPRWSVAGHRCCRQRRGPGCR